MYKWQPEWEKWKNRVKWNDGVLSILSKKKESNRRIIRRDKRGGTNIDDENGMKFIWNLTIYQ